MKASSTIRLVTAGDTASPSQTTAERLKDLCDRLDEPHTFAKGDVIRWKANLRNRMSPEYFEPVVVTDVLATPIFDPSANSANSPYFREALTIVIGIFREEDVLEFHVDGRRFEPVTD